MYKFFGWKRVAALIAAVAITFTAFGSGNNGLIEGSAISAKQEYENELVKLEKQQSELDKEIADADKKLSSEKDTYQALLDKYNAIKKKVSNTQAAASKVEDDMVTLDTKQRETQVSIDKQKAEIKTTEKEFMKRIRAMYVAGGADSYTNVLVNSEDFYDVLMRIELVTRVAKHDSTQLDELLAQQKKLEDTQSKLKTQLEQLKQKSADYSKLQTELATEQEKVTKMQNESGNTIIKLQDNKDSLVSKSSELSQKQSEVSSKALTTTTTTTAATTTTTAKKTTYQKATTTKKSSSGNGSGGTTTKAPVYTTYPQTTTNAQNNNGPTYPSSNSKVDTVVNYAKSNVGGAYVWAGSNFRATDCSGLMMLSYAQIGIQLPHLASSQASYGTAVSYGNMQPGDMIFFGSGSYSSIYHVAMYIGGGRMVHAENTSVGIVISDVASFSAYNHIVVIKRLLN